MLYCSGDNKRTLENEPFLGGLEPENYRNDFRRDYDRLIHAPSFRRLQGKTQLFPGVESDFFRNRLTHSLEVAQIAKSIAIRLDNIYNDSGLEKRESEEANLGISHDLVEFAGLAHDLGHPPFGHQGEIALDRCMLNYGGFEGNAQTIRILSRIEKKFFKNGDYISRGKDKRVGLNLTMRSLASILKYDKIIPPDEKTRKELAGASEIKPVKGYYKCDELLIKEIKRNVLDNRSIKSGAFKTLECYIMDIADDIAYSTYDLEDGFKAGFISPLDLLYPEDWLIKDVCQSVNVALEKEEVGHVLTPDKIVDLIRSNFLDFGESQKTEIYSSDEKSEHFLDLVNTNVEHQYLASKIIANNGSYRTNFMSSIVGRFIRGVELHYNEQFPSMSKAKLTDDTRVLVEILKTFTYKSQISSPRLKIAEYRGQEIVTKIFETLNSDVGYKLMPYDMQEVYNQASEEYQKRIICDFISSMTDKYAIEFYGRLTSEDPETIFKPF